MTRTGDETGSRLIDQMRRNWPDSATPSAELLIRLYRLRDLVWSRSQEKARDFGLTWGEFEALAALRASDPPHRMTPTEISGLMIVTSGGLTKIIQNLESKRLVRRAGNEADARSCFIEITEEGSGLIGKLTRAISDDIDPLIDSALSNAEQRSFVRALAALSCAAEERR